MFNASLIACTIGASGIPGVTTNGPPVQSTDAAVPVFALDTSGAVISLGSVAPYNINSQAIPAGAFATLKQTNNGRYYVDRFLGQTTPTPPIAAVNQSPSF
ncbi:MAG: hypothetical protein ACYC61_14140 [Isosphaeraceae bacterium]